LIAGIPDRPINPALAAIKNERPGSLHPGGAMAAFCDGHTKFIGDELANHVFIQLMTSDMTWNGANYVNRNASPNGISPRINALMQAAFPAPYVLSEADIK
jgi:prepilin-type processing-associated H-X9-DG protein